MLPGTHHTSSSSTRASSKCATSKPGVCARSSPETTYDASGMGAGAPRRRSRQVPVERGRKRRRKRHVCTASCALTTLRRVGRARRAPGAASCSTYLSLFPPSRSSSQKSSRRPRSTRRLCTRRSTAHHELLSHLQKRNEPFDEL